MKSVIARDAASLLVYRKKKNQLEVLVGKRSERAKFAPGVYVFPGGNMEDADKKILINTRMDPDGVPSGASKDIQALALTAIRETWEETGILLSNNGSLTRSTHPTWEKFRKRELVPAPEHISYLGRAITPAESDIRFHARFFTVDWKYCKGEIRSGGELSDLRWVAISNPEALPMFDVTEFMLEQLTSLIYSQNNSRPILSYRLGKTLVRYE